MGTTRYIGKIASFTIEQEQLLISTIENPESISSKTTEERQKIFDLAIKAFNVASIYHWADNRPIRGSFVDTEERTLAPFITQLAKAIGTIKGTLSFWDPQKWHTDLVATCNLEGVERLNLGNCDGVNMRALIGKLPNLNRLRLRNHVSDIQLIREFLANCPRLEVLCFNGRQKVTELLEWAPNIKELKLNKNELSLNDLSLLRKRIREGTLHTLDLSYCKIESGIKWLQLLVDGKNTLQSLALSKVELWGYRRSQLKLIIDCTKLRRLFLDNASGLTDSKLQELLQNNPNLEELDLEGLSDLTDASFSILKEYGKNLKRIVIADSMLSEVATQAFVTDKPQLEYISINRNHTFRDDHEADYRLAHTHFRYWGSREFFA